MRWRETGDVPAALAVFVVGALGAGLGGVSLMQAASNEGMDSALLVAAFALLAPCALAMLAAVCEFTREHVVAINGRCVSCVCSSLGRNRSFAEPLCNFRGLQIVDRSRRLYIRNQDHPLTGRRGPVTEFAIVLRHNENRTCDVELFRAQPSLESLLTMYSMQDAARGRTSAANAGACAELVAGYRQALVRLCGQLEMPVLITGAGDELHEWPVESLDEWLRPPAS
jgi:hypothetical protein